MAMTCGLVKELGWRTSLKREAQINSTQSQGTPCPWQGGKLQNKNPKDTEKRSPQSANIHGLVHPQCLSFQVHILQELTRPTLEFSQISKSIKIQAWMKIHQWCGCHGWPQLVLSINRGTPLSLVGLFHGQIHPEMDENWGYQRVNTHAFP